MSKGGNSGDGRSGGSQGGGGGRNRKREMAVKKKLWAGLATGLFWVGMVGMASATPITYSFDGIGSGVLGGTAFANTEISFDLHADTDDVYGAGTFFNNVNSSAINIVGFSTASFTTVGLKMFMNSSNNALGFGDSMHNDLLDIMDSALAGYDLTTSIGVTYEPDPFAFSQFNNVSTTFGLMTLSNVNWVNFSATTNTSVPEPATMLLFGTGIAGLAGTRIRRKKK